MPRRLNIVARLLIVIAVTMIAFAHKPIILANGPDLAAYTPPDGSEPVLCTTHAGDTEKAMPGEGCDACRLTAAVMLPEPPVLNPSAVEFPHRRDIHCSDIPAPATAAISRSRPRAPPILA